jgi:predicted DsbA family dithiol-disulfide isomerase
MPLSKLFPNRNLGAMHAQMAQFAAGFGVEMRFSDRLPNTRRPLALAEHARSQGKLHPFRDAAMDAHWLRGVDIESDGVLKELAAQAGLDPDAALAAADSPEMQARVDAMGEEAKRWGVTGIPTYFLLPKGWSPGDPPPTDGSRPVRIVGCQPYEQVLAGCMRAGVDRRT